MSSTEESSYFVCFLVQIIVFLTIHLVNRIKTDESNLMTLQYRSEYFAAINLCLEVTWVTLNDFFHLVTTNDIEHDDYLNREKRDEVESNEARPKIARK